MGGPGKDTPHIMNLPSALKPLVILSLFLLLPSALFSADDSIDISADHLEYSAKTDTYSAKGSAVIIYQDTRLEADEMYIVNETSDATATGNVVYEDPEVIIKGSKVELNLKSKLGTIYDSYIFYKNRNIHLYGGDIEKTGERSFTLDKARVTSCDADVPAWHIEGKEVKATQDKSLSAWHTTFNIRNRPVLYSPYAWYPLDRERQTGFLFPEFGYSSTRSYYYKQGFFWALKENQDATFHLDYYGEKGLAQGLNYRYIVNPESKGELWVYHVRDDDTKRDLTEVKSYSDQKLPYNMRGYLKIHAVSEYDYYNEMDSTSQGKIGVRSWEKTNPFGFVSEERLQKYLESNMQVEKSFRGSRAYLLGQYRQSLEGSSSLVPQYLPEAGYVLYTQSKGPFAFNLTVKGNNIWRSEGQKAMRIDLNPNLYFSYGRILNVTQKIGVRETVYHLERPGGSTDRTIVDLTTALSTTLFKRYKSFVHIFEPSLQYRYIPNVDQSNIPFFDSLDAIPHTSSIGYAFTNRLSGLNTTYLEARFRLSQSYSLLNVEKNFSPLLAEATLASKNIDISLNASYDVHDEEFSETIALARLKNSIGYIGVGKNFRSVTNLDQLTLEGALYSPIRLRGKAIPIGINGKIWYDLNGNGVQELTVSSTYSHQCWGLTLTYNRNSQDYQILVAIELKGLTTFSLGSTDSLLSNTSY